MLQILSVKAYRAPIPKGALGSERQRRATAENSLMGMLSSSPIARKDYQKYKPSLANNTQEKKFP